METIYYDHQFNSNEWFIIIMLIIGYSVIWALPRRFSRGLSLVIVLIGIYIGLLMDHTISIVPFDYYDVNDNSSYQISDFFTYVMYGPYSYLFIYLYNRWRVEVKYAPLYILVWVIFGLGLEWFGVVMGVFHYKNGYQIYYSFPLYFIFQCVLLLLYYVMMRKQSI